MQFILRPFLGETSDTTVMLSTHMEKADEQRRNLQPLYAVGAQRIEKAAYQFSDALLTAVNDDVSKAYKAEAQIEKELSEIERLMSINATQTDQWTNLLDRLNLQLMEMGDIANWAESMEKTSKEINEICHSITTTSSSSQSDSTPSTSKQYK